MCDRLPEPKWVAARTRGCRTRIARRARAECSQARAFEAIGEFLKTAITGGARPSGSTGMFGGPIRRLAVQSAKAAETRRCCRYNVHASCTCSPLPPVGATGKMERQDREIVHTQPCARHFETDKVANDDFAAWLGCDRQRDLECVYIYMSSTRVCEQSQAGGTHGW
jgi:hypothetical protein